MKICFFGVGGVGGYYATLLAKYLNETGGGISALWIMFLLKKQEHNP